MSLAMVTSQKEFYVKVFPLPNLVLQISFCSFVAINSKQWSSTDYTLTVHLILRSVFFSGKGNGLKKQKKNYKVI